MPFEPGRSGNPSGRPKTKLSDGRTLSDVAKEHTERAVDALVAVLTDKRASAAAKVQAATALLDRGWGRPHQSVSASAATFDVTVLAAANERARAYRAQADNGNDADMFELS